MLKRVLIATVAGTVVIFVLAGLCFGLLFANFFASNFPQEFAGVNKTETNYLLIFVADLLYAGMLAFVLDAARVRTFGRGALFGLVIGFSVVLHFDLIGTATTYLTTLPGVAANVAISSVMSATAGGVVATVLAKLQRKPD